MNFRFFLANCHLPSYRYKDEVTIHLQLQGVQGRDQEGGALDSGKSWQDRQAFRCCCCSVLQLFPTLCYPMECSTPGFCVFHHPSSELAQTHVRWLSDAIQPSPSPSAFTLSHHQGLYHPQGRLFELGGQNIQLGNSSIWRVKEWIPQTWKHEHKVYCKR